jgi:hypothetical protein
MRSHTLAMMSLGLALTACQSKHRALSIVCNAPIDCADCAAGTAEERQGKTAEYIGQRVRNSEVEDLFERIVKLDPATSQQQLEQAILDAGIESCPFIEDKP